MRILGKKLYASRHHLRLQQGQVILVTVLLIGLTVSISLFSLIRPRSPSLDVDAQTELALAQAKQALITYASGRATTNRPGELPCPDLDNDGQAGQVSDATCNTTDRQIGRLPWVTLRTADLRDGSGERLWYAVSSNFKNNAVVTPLNSNTPGQLSVTGIAPANSVIAIVFAANTAIAGQNRSAANVNNVVHYLEGENANNDTLFTTAAPSGTFNDRLLAITPSMFFPQVEMRVAREARVLLNAYFATRNFFPFAYGFGGSLPCSTSTLGIMPRNPENCGGGQLDWSSVAIPSWFWPNNWDQVLAYSPAPACTNPAATGCLGVGGFLTVNGTSNIQAVIIAPGVAYTGQSRPCAVITDCLEPPNTTSFPTLTHVTGSNTINDRVVIVAP